MTRFVEKRDVQAISDIYNYYVQHAIATFEEVPITAAEMEKRIDAIYPQFPWIVYEADGLLLGYAYANAWKTRSAYIRTVETSVYITPNAVGKGIGKELYQYLIQELKAAGMHVLIGGISLPNEASVRLHERMGFEKVAHFKEVGFKFGQWLDVGYWELML